MVEGTVKMISMPVASQGSILYLKFDINIADREGEVRGHGGLRDSMSQ